VGRDEPRRQDAVARLDGLVRLGAVGLTGAYRDDAPAVDDHATVAQETVAVAVERDDVTGVDDHASGHVLALLRRAILPGFAAP
jgi:hypothetical protein